MTYREEQAAVVQLCCTFGLPILYLGCLGLTTAFLLFIGIVSVWKLLVIPLGYISALIMLIGMEMCAEVIVDFTVKCMTPKHER